MSASEQAQRIHITFACPVQWERLQDVHPHQALNMNMADRGDRDGEGGRVILDNCGGEDWAPAVGMERVHFVGRAG